MGCVQSIVGKKKLLVQFEYGQNKEIGSSSLVFLSLKEEVDMDEPISHLPEKEESEFLTINGDPEVGEPCIFVKRMYLSVFYFCSMIRMYLQIYRSTMCRKREIQT